MTLPMAFLNLNPMEILILLALGLLLFGRKLPEVGRYLGKGIVEFKKGMKGMEDDLDMTPAPRNEALPMSSSPPQPPQRVITPAPKFENNGGSITMPPKT